MKWAYLRRSIRIAIKALILGILLVGIGLAWPRERLLMETARPIVKMDSEKEQALWLSGDRLLLMTTEQEGSEEETAHGSPIRTHWRGFADILDTRTGVRTRLDGLTRLLNTVMPPPITRPGRLQLSPEGAWFLWTPEEEHGFASPRAASLDGTHYRDLKTDDNRLCLFLEEGYLLQLSTVNSHAIIRDLLNATKDRTYSGIDQVNNALAKYTAPHPTDLSVSIRHTKHSSPDVEIVRNRMEDHIQHRLNRGDHAYRFPSPLWKQRLTLPEGAMIFNDLDTGVSPQQEAIFYDLVVEHLPPMMAALKRSFPKLRIEATLTQELWLSRSDGQDMHTLGYVPWGPPKETDETGDYMRDIQWLPEGKRISFIYRGTLYVVPARAER